MKAFLEEKDAVRNLALILDSDNIKTRIEVLYLLAIVCSWSNAGFELVLDAFNHYKLVKRESTRFADLVKNLKTVKDQEYKGHIMMMINALLSSPPEETTRIFLQKEFRNLGLMDIVAVSVTISIENLSIVVGVERNFRYRNFGCTIEYF